MSSISSGAKETSLAFFFKPILAPVLSLIILHEKISFNMAAGSVFILIGSMVLLKKQMIPLKRK